MFLLLLAPTHPSSHLGSRRTSGAERALPPLQPLKALSPGGHPEYCLTFKAKVKALKALPNTSTEKKKTYKTNSYFKDLRTTTDFFKSVGLLLFVLLEKDFNVVHRSTPTLVSNDIHCHLAFSKMEQLSLIDCSRCPRSPSSCGFTFPLELAHIWRKPGSPHYRNRGVRFIGGSVTLLQPSRDRPSCASTAACPARRRLPQPSVTSSRCPPPTRQRIRVPFQQQKQETAPEEGFNGKDQASSASLCDREGRNGCKTGGHGTRCSGAPAAPGGNPQPRLTLTRLA